MSLSNNPQGQGSKQASHCAARILPLASFRSFLLSSLRWCRPGSKIRPLYQPLLSLETTFDRISTRIQAQCSACLSFTPTERTCRMFAVCFANVDFSAFKMLESFVRLASPNWNSNSLVIMTCITMNLYLSQYKMAFCLFFINLFPRSHKVFIILYKKLPVI